MAKFNIREQDPQKYSAVKAEQDKLSAICGVQMKIARICPYCGHVRCLCPKCLNDYIHDPNYIVRRADPFAKKKDKCDKCGGSGWDYILYDRRNPSEEGGVQR